MTLASEGRPVIQGERCSHEHFHAGAPSMRRIETAVATCRLGWMADSRTRKIEEITAFFFEAPLTAESVFLRPARLDGPNGEREVCDVLVALRDQGILLSLKSQDAAEPRDGDRLRRWCAKHARKAASQISGARRAMRDQPFWCQHRRRGHVNF